LENIVVVNGPGSFTGIRTISLIANTINYVIKKDLTEFSYFDLFDTYPICKPSSKRDTFVKKSESDEIEIIQNPDLENYFKENNIKKVS
jgi:hydrogenase maturation factor